MTDANIAIVSAFYIANGIVDPPQHDQIQTRVQTGESVPNVSLQLIADILKNIPGMDTPQEIELCSTPALVKGHRTDSLTY